ncbi:MAG: flotillin family protein, partial [Planctomycetota bacterium]
MVLAWTGTVPILVGAGLVFLIFISTIIAWKAFYKKAKADEAFVRTGMGGAKVFADAGGFIVPLVHEIKWISLETMRLEVERKSKDALITNDKFRVDVKVEFYIRVPARSDQILTAARSLGEKSLSADSVKELVEAKLVGALRSVAATKNMIELHEDRDGFADEVQKALMNDLPQNGLNLESVSIVFLDQTDKDVLDPKNVFDAEGLKLITDATERARKEKNEIARRAEVAIKEQDVRAVKEKLELERDQEYAAAAQYKEVETYRAEREAETMKFKIEQEQSVREREISKERAISEAEILKEQQIKEADISREQRVREADIAKETYLIARQKEREETEIQKELAIEVAKREKEIGIIQKEKERELEHAKELEAVAEKERAHQAVITVEKTAEADREKDVVLINQRAESEKDQIDMQVAADAAAYEVMKRAEAEQKSAEMKAAAI